MLKNDRLEVRIFICKFARSTIAASPKPLGLGTAPILKHQNHEHKNHFILNTLMLNNS